MQSVNTNEDNYVITFYFSFIFTEFSDTIPYKYSVHSMPYILCTVFCSLGVMLTLKHRETHGCVVSTVATDAPVLKHQAISILSTD